MRTANASPATGGAPVMSPGLSPVVIGVVAGVVAALSPVTVCAAALVALTAWGIRRQWPGVEGRWLARMVVWGWTGRVVLSACLHLLHIRLFPHGPIALEADSGGFLGLGWMQAEVWQGYYASLHDAAILNWNVYQGMNPFSFLMGTLFHWWGFSPVGATFINAWIALCAFVACYAVARDLAGPQVARGMLWLVMLAPSWWFWSVTHGKEPYLLLATAVWLWAGGRWVRTLQARWLLPLPVTALLMASTRPWMAALFTAVLAVVTAAAWVRQRPWRRRTCGAALVGGLLLLVAVPSAHMLVSRRVLGVAATMERQYEMSYAMGGATYQIYDARDDAMSWSVWIRALARGWRQIIFSYWPPFRVTSMSQWVTLPEVVALVLLVPLATVGWLRLLFDHRSLAGWLLALTMMVFLTILPLSQANVGTLFRHKQLMLPFYYLAVVMGWRWLLRLDADASS